LNPGGGTTEAENKGWGNAVPLHSPLLWSLTWSTQWRIILKIKWK